MGPQIAFIVLYQLSAVELSPSLSGVKSEKKDIERYKEQLICIGVKMQTGPGKRRRALYLVVAFLALLPYQNCGQGFSSSETAEVASSGSPDSPGTSGAPVNPGSSGTVTTTTSTTTTTTLAGQIVRCELSTVQAPRMTGSTVTTATVLSGQGNEAGRIPSSETLTFRFDGVTVGANCSAGVILRVEEITSRRSLTRVGVGSSERVAVSGEIFTVTRTGGNEQMTAAGQSRSIRFSVEDNNTTQQCLAGTAVFRVFLESSADPAKDSNSQEITVTVRNNCYPESRSQPLTGSLDSFDQMGSAVSIDGDLAASLATGDDGEGNSNPNMGAVYVFKRTNGVWALLQTLRSSDGAAEEKPQSLSLRGSYLVVGSEFRASNSVVVYGTGADGRFAQLGRINAPVAGSKFGRSVALSPSGDLLAVGAPAESSGAGAVYILRTGTTDFPQQQRLAGPANAYFGYSVAMDANVLGVGGPGLPQYEEVRSLTGQVFIYTKDGSGRFSGGAATVTPTPSVASQVGYSVSVFNGKVLVGAPGFKQGTNATGAAFLFDSARVLRGTFLNPTDTADGARYGEAVALSAAGSFVTTPESNNRKGSFDHYNASTNARVRSVFPQQGSDSDYFGNSIAASGTDLMVGSFRNADPNNTSGSVSLISTVVP
jgi:hypothetical protein